MIEEAFCCWRTVIVNAPVRSSNMDPCSSCVIFPAAQHGTCAGPLQLQERPDNLPDFGRSPPSLYLKRYYYTCKPFDATICHRERNPDTRSHGGCGFVRDYGGLKARFKSEARLSDLATTISIRSWHCYDCSLCIFACPHGHGRMTFLCMSLLLPRTSSTMKRSLIRSILTSST